MEIRILATDYKFAPVLKNQEASKLEVSGWIKLELQEFKKKYWFSRQSSWMTMKWTKVVVHKIFNTYNV